MQKITMAALIFMAAVSVVFGVGYMRVSNGVGTLAQRVDQLEGEKRALEAERNGLREANADLIQHLEQTRRLAVHLPEPVVEPSRMRFMDLPPVEDGDAEFDAVVFEGNTERELTPEERAEREAREQEREERRQAWQERREAMRERAIDEAQVRREFFELVSLEGLAPEYVEAHQRLLAGMDEVQVRMAALNDPDLSREEQREIRRELGQLGREISGLMNTQREILLNDYAQAMGFQGADARVFIDAIETINEMTSLRGLLWGGGRGGPSGGGR
jgi:hypothetical protein